jgi:hypothetical protein
MELRIMALYPIKIPSLAGRPGVRLRNHKGRAGTLVPCRIESVGGVSVARPVHAVPDATPTPLYRAQLETLRAPVEERRSVCVVLAADRAAGRIDPEQAMLSPIFDDGRRMIYEFRRAHVVTVSDRGEVEVRLVAVHPVTGVVGTQTIYRFHTRYSALATRCEEYLVGTLDLFPIPERGRRAPRVDVPKGEANLSFGSTVARPPDRSIVKRTQDEL